VVDFEAVFRHSPNPYMIVGTDLRYLAANQAYASAVSATVESLIGRHVFDAFPGGVDTQGRSETDPVRLSIERVIATGKPDALAIVPFAIERETPQGRVFEERFWSATHTPLFGDDGRLYGVLQHTTDVTDVERDRAELAERRLRGGGATPEQIAQGVFSRARFVQDANMALDAQRRNLESLFAQAPGFMAVLRGSDYRYEIANSAYDELIGRRTPIGERLVDVLPEIVGQGYVNLLDQVRQTARRFVGRGMQVNLQHDAGDARYVDFIYQPIVDEHGRVDAIFVQGADVTDREAALAALRESEQRFRTIADMIPQMVWSALPDGFHDYYNPQWYAYTGVPEGSTDARTCSTATAPRTPSSSPRPPRPRAWC